MKSIFFTCSVWIETTFFSIEIGSVEWNVPMVPINKYTDVRNIEKKHRISENGSGVKNIQRQFITLIQK